MALSLVVLPSNAEAERSFSVQNRIKTRLRNQIAVERLDKLIRLSYCGIKMEDFDYNAALELYMLDNHRWY